MKKIIHNLRKQPEDTRKHILNVVMLVVIAVLIVFWVISLKNDFSSTETKERIKNDIKPFTILKESILSDN
ncbi:MAG: hypothetical protein WCX79_03435 [Candidatus Paceibacterota bacterium]|jgi:H+/gluconate symporter-like permease